MSSWQRLISITVISAGTGAVSRRLDWTTQACDSNSSAVTAQGLHDMNNCSDQNGYEDLGLESEFTSGHEIGIGRR